MKLNILSKTFKWTLFLSSKMTNKLLFSILILLAIISASSLAFLGDKLFFSKEIDSPGDWIKQDQIKVYPDKVILDIPDSSWLYFTDTNSMDPFIDADANAIQVKPNSPEEIEIGDIITYKNQSELIIHRVIDINKDKYGIYYTVKGDNNSTSDPVKVRFEDIEGVVVAVIY